jgi:hypothetical protein
MDPTLSGFALGLLLAAAKVGVIGTVWFGIAWWRTRARLRKLETALPDPGRLDERLARLEELADYSASRMDRLIEDQSRRSEKLIALPPKPSAGSD